MIEFLDFLIDLLMFGDSFFSLRRISDGDDTERESPLYAAPEMRRLRWAARALVLTYLVAIIALPCLAFVYIDSSPWLSQAAGGYFIAGIFIYIGLVWAGFALLRSGLRRKRREIAAQLAAR